MDSLLKKFDVNLDVHVQEHLILSLEEIDDEEERYQLFHDFLGEELTKEELEQFIKEFLALKNSADDLEGNDNGNLDRHQDNGLVGKIRDSNKSSQKMESLEGGMNEIDSSNNIESTVKLETLLGSQESLDLLQKMSSISIPKSQSRKAKKAAAKAFTDSVRTPNNENEQASEEPADITQNWSSQGPIGKRMAAVRKAKKLSKYTNNATIIPEALIQATSRQSRFKEDTLETLSNDVDLKTVNLSIGKTSILVDANLKLKAGVKYGLIGRNGVGKSTLFKAMGYKLLIGFPKNIRVMFVEQLESVDENSIVLDVVLAADLKSWRAKKEFDALSKASEGDSKTVAQTIRQILLDRLEDDLRLADQVATKTSGARGATARTDLLVLEVQVEQARERLTAPHSQQELENSVAKALEMMEELHSTLQLYDHDAAEAKVCKILDGLGFSKDWIYGPIGKLSGGWKIRVSLAQALFVEPDILLLDEPTNALDLPAILWLQNYLSTLDNVTLVVISHDRAFLDAVVEEIIVLRNKTLTYFVGNYDEYRSNLIDVRKHQQKQAEALEKKKSHIESSIQHGLKQAKAHGDDKKLSQVAARKKKLNERFGIERSASGHRFKLNQDMVGYFENGSRLGVEVDRDDPPVRWSFPNPELLRVHNAILEIDNISFSYEPGNFILRNVTMNVPQGARIGIVGANGEGKSTLVKLMIGLLSPTKGIINRLPQARIGYLSQSHVEEISKQPEHLTTLAYIQQKLPNEQEDALRRHFGSFGIGAQMNQPIKSLSGGQAVRVATGICTWNIPHLLILDEPSNHLDMDTITAVQEALTEFNGTVIVVSHDQHFISNVTNEVYLVKGGSVELLEGGIDEYIKRATKKVSKK